MYTEAVTKIALGVALASVCGAVFIVRRVKKQLLEMSDALEDVKNGNGNRRILSETHELVAPLAYAVNDIILSYENRLSAYRQTEETNRQLMTSLSHDVRTPLTTLIGYLDAAHKGIVDGKERDDYIETKCDRGRSEKGSGKVHRERELFLSCFSHWQNESALFYGGNRISVLRGFYFFRDLLL